MMVFFVEKEAVVFVTAEMVLHDGRQQIDDLMKLLFAHAGGKNWQETPITEMAQKIDERLLIGGTIESKKHVTFRGMTLCIAFEKGPRATVRAW
jgi:hypothetical protein